MTDVVVPVVLKGDEKDIVQASQRSQKSLKELRKELNATQKSVKRTEDGFGSFGGALRDTVPVVGRFGDAVNRIFTGPTGVAVSIGAAGVAAAKSVTDFAALADEIGKIAPTINATTEALSEYDRVAALSGVSFEKVVSGFEQLTIRLGEGADRTVEALDTLGLTIEQLQGLRVEDQFELIADRISDIENPATRAATAARLFGKANIDLLKILNQGSAAIRQYRREAQAAGETIGQEQADDAARYNDELERLTRSFTGLSRSTGAFLVGPGADTLTYINDAIEGWSRFFDLLVEGRGVWESLQQAFAAVRPGDLAIDRANELRRLKEAVQEARIEIAALNEAFEYDKLPEAEIKLQEAQEALEDFTKAAQEAAKASDDVGERADTNAGTFRDRFGPAVRGTTDDLRTYKVVVEDADAQVKAFEENQRSLEQSFNEQTAAIQANKGALDDLVVTYDGLISDLRASEAAVDSAAEAWATLGQTALNALTATVGTFARGGSLTDAAQSIAPLVGAGIGSAVGSIFPVIGTAVGGAIGSAIGGAVSGLFGGDGEKRRTVSLQSRPLGFPAPDRGPVGDTGFIATSELRKLLIAGSGGIRPEGGQELLDTLVEIDNTIASLLSPEELQDAIVSAGIASRQTAGSADFTNVIEGSYERIFEGIGGPLNEAFKKVTDGADQTVAELQQIINSLASIDKAIDEGTISDELPGGIDEVVDRLVDLKEGNEGLLETYNRLIIETDTLEAELQAMGAAVTDVTVETADAIVDLAGGLDKLVAGTRFFREQFLTEEERQALDVEAAEAEVAAFLEKMQELGFEVDTSREGFKEFVQNLDLSTEAGQEAYVASLDAARAIDLLADVSEAAAAAEEEERKAAEEKKKADEEAARAAAERAKADQEAAKAAERAARTLSGIASLEVAQSDFAKFLSGSQSKLFAESVSEELALERARTEKELRDVDERIKEYIRKGYSTTALRKFRSRLQAYLDEVRGDQQLLAQLEREFPGLGEARFNLIKEFQALFDGTELSAIEREIGLQRFLERWQEIVDEFNRQQEEGGGDGGGGGAGGGVGGGTIEQEQDRTGRTIAEFLQDFLLGANSPLSQEEQLRRAEERLQELQQRAAAGEDVSASDLIQAQEDLIREIRETFGVGEEAERRIEDATQQFAELARLLAATADDDVALEQLDALKEIIDELQELRNTIVRTTPSQQQRTI